MWCQQDGVTMWSCIDVWSLSHLPFQVKCLSQLALDSYLSFNYYFVILANLTYFVPIVSDVIVNNDASEKSNFPHENSNLYDSICTSYFSFWVINARCSSATHITKEYIKLSLFYVISNLCTPHKERTFSCLIQCCWKNSL